MSSKLLPAILLALVTVAACSKDGRSLTDPSSPANPGSVTTEDGGPAIGPGSDDASDPVTNGTWTQPDGSAPTIQPVPPETYVPAGSGSAGTSGQGTTLVFQTSGTARLGVGTCGPDGTWTDALGDVYGPNNPNCLGYAADGTAGLNGKGQCVESADGYRGLWLNPQAHPTSPYHSNCLQTAGTSALALSFPAAATLYQANDGSGAQVLQFVQDGMTVAQLFYRGAADGTTSGAGVLVGTDDASPARLWTVDFAQPALNFTGATANGDLVARVRTEGVAVVACNTEVGCSLVTLQLSMTP